MAHPPRFFSETPLHLGTILLSPEESTHATRVLRLDKGDRVEVFDGEGSVGSGELEEAKKDCVTLCIQSIERISRSRPKLTLATAVPKGKRWHVLIEKCTELGVDRIIPIRATWSVATAEGDPRRLRRWTIEACKQSRNPYLPRIDPPTPLPSILTRIHEERSSVLPLLTDPRGEPLLSILPRFENNDASSHHELPPRGVFTWTEEILVLIGPEAGWTNEEYTVAQNAGFLPISLGTSILRIETAAIAASSIVLAWRRTVPSHER